MATTHLIAVGTQGGFVLVFDSCQVLVPHSILSSNLCFKVIKWFLGGLDLGSNYGAVSSLAFNSDSTRLKKMEKVGLPPIALCRLLAGFARGQLVEWDITTGKVYSQPLYGPPPYKAIEILQFNPCYSCYAIWQTFTHRALAFSPPGTQTHLF